jgi:hypothetical protein
MLKVLHPNGIKQDIIPLKKIILHNGIYDGCRISQGAQRRVANYVNDEIIILVKTGMET